MEPRPFGQPSLNAGRLVRAVVVHDEVDVDVRRHAGVHAVEELPKLDRPVPTMRLPDHRAGLDVEGREQRRGPVTPVVVGPPFGLSGLHWQQGGRAVQGLNLGLLVDAQHHGVVGWIHIQPDDVPYLVDEQRIGRQLERFAAVGAQSEGSPDAADGHSTQPRRAGERTRAPVRDAGRSGLQRSDDHLLDLVIGDGARGTWSRLIQKAIESLPRKARAPLTYGRRRQAQTPGHRLVVLTRRAAEHDASSPRHLRGGAGPSSQRLEVLSFGLGQNDGNRRASRSHTTSQSQGNGAAQHYTLSSGTGH